MQLHQTSDKFSGETPRQRKRRELLAKRAEADFTKANNAAGGYGAALRAYARQISHIIEHFAVGGIVPPEAMPRLREALTAYTKGIKPWAQRTTARMIAEVNRRNLTAWKAHTAGMSAEMRATIVSTPIGDRVKELLDGQVHLITSLPLDAAERVHSATLEALETGTRYRSTVPDGDFEGSPSAVTVSGEDVEAALARAHPDATAQWLKNRATLIARTETARTASVLTQARAESIDATHYIWRTAGDYRVRTSHRKLNGTVQAWTDPPLCDPPDYHANPGSIWNCRCVAIPIVE